MNRCPRVAIVVVAARFPACSVCQGDGGAYARMFVLARGSLTALGLGAQCNKMTCPNCGTLSCYICRKVIVGYDHFNNVSRRRSHSYVHSAKTTDVNAFTLRRQYRSRRGRVDDPTRRSALCGTRR